MVMQQFNKILIVQEQEDLMVEMVAMEEFKIKIMILKINANKIFQWLIILEKKLNLKDLEVQAGIFSNRKEVKVVELSGWLLQGIQHWIILELVQKVSQEWCLKEEAKVQEEEQEDQFK